MSIPPERSVYRVIGQAVPTREDFESDRARGLAPDPNLPPEHWGDVRLAQASGWP